MATTAPESSETPNWEALKENVLPVKKGRSAKGLSMKLAENNSKMDNKAREQAFEDLLDAAKSPKECLQSYIKYIKWIREEYPSNSDKTLQLLERCTVELKSEAELKNDGDFIKVWVEYADMVRTPGEVFSFMLANKIGEKVALYWIAYAFVAEKAKNFKLTDQIFQKGIRRNAEPKDVLQKRYQQFQRRLARHYLDQAENGNDDIVSSSVNNNNEVRSSRATLGLLSEQQANVAGASRAPLTNTTNNHNNNYNSGTTAALVAMGSTLRNENVVAQSVHRADGTTSSSSSGSSRRRLGGGGGGSSTATTSTTTSGTIGAKKSQNKGLEFNIFSDNGPSAAAVTAPPPPAGVPLAIYSDNNPSNSTWNNLGTESERRKENEGPVTKWTDAPLLNAQQQEYMQLQQMQQRLNATGSVAATAPVSTAPSFAIFQDDTASTASAAAVATASSSTTIDGANDDGQQQHHHQHQAGLSIRRALDSKDKEDVSLTVDRIAKRPLTRHMLSTTDQQAGVDGGGTGTVIQSEQEVEVEEKSKGKLQDKNGEKGKEKLSATAPTVSAPTAAASAPVVVPSSSSFAIFSDALPPPPPAATAAPRPPAAKSIEPIATATSSTSGAPFSIFSDTAPNPTTAPKSTAKKSNNTSSSNSSNSSSLAATNGRSATSNGLQTAAKSSSSSFAIFSDSPATASSSVSVVASVVKEMPKRKPAAAATSNNAASSSPFAIFSDEPLPTTASSSATSSASTVAPAVVANKPAVSASTSSFTIFSDKADPTANSTIKSNSTTAPIAAKAALAAVTTTTTTPARCANPSISSSSSSVLNESAQLDNMLAELIGGDMEDATINTRMARCEIDDLFHSPTTKFSHFKTETKTENSLFTPAAPAAAHSGRSSSSGFRDENEPGLFSFRSHSGSQDENDETPLFQPATTSKPLQQSSGKPPVQVLHKGLHRPFGVEITDLSSVQDLSMIKESSQEYSVCGNYLSPRGERSRKSSSSSSDATSATTDHR